MKFPFLLIIMLSLLVCVSAESISAQATYFYTGSNAIAVKDGDSLEYQFMDRSTSINYVLDSNLNEKFYKSLPFGQEIIEGNRFAFTGKELDGSGLHYFSARYYDTSLGRFTTADPIRANHPYTYVGGNPLNYIDPTGLMAFGLKVYAVTPENMIPGLSNPNEAYGNFRNFFLARIRANENEPWATVGVYELRDIGALEEGQHLAQPFYDETENAMISYMDFATPEGGDAPSYDLQILTYTENSETGLLSPTAETEIIHVVGDPAKTVRVDPDTGLPVVVDMNSQQEEPEPEQIPYDLMVFNNPSSAPVFSPKGGSPESTTRIQVYNLKGALVSTSPKLVSGEKWTITSSGGSRPASGMYLYRAINENNVMVQQGKVSIVR